MADAGAGLDAGNLGILHTGPDEPGPAARNEQVHKTNGRHQCVGGGVGGVLDEGDGGFRQTVFLQAAAQGLHDGVGRTPGLPAAAQDADVATLDGEGGGVAGHIGAALVDNGDDAHGHGGLFDDQTVGPLNALEHSTYRVPCNPQAPEELTEVHHRPVHESVRLRYNPAVRARPSNADVQRSIHGSDNSLFS